MCWPNSIGIIRGTSLMEETTALPYNAEPALIEEAVLENEKTHTENDLGCSKVRQWALLV